MNNTQTLTPIAKVATDNQIIESLRQKFQQNLIKLDNVDNYFIEELHQKFKNNLILF
jgi:hypothetical protein